MKIMIYAHPRSGSSIFGHIVSRIFNVEWMREPFTAAPGNYGQTLDYIRDNNVAFKVQCFNFNFFERADIDYKSLDRVYITERLNKTDAVVSHFIASINNTWAYQTADPLLQIREFHVPFQFVEMYQLYIKHFQETMYWFYDKHIPYEILYYEDFVKPSIAETAKAIAAQIGETTDITEAKIRHSGIDYKHYCTNYDQITQQLEDLRARDNLL